ncbi:aldo/keto reductase [Deinococcus psychrotolerans]|uniref:Aldo/keto reductase n=1 Tax=Deinococcus psychrotolerans TaxID=2489213 RepID=A0A3G8YMF4_9DEIO|nr:aldo/keto reductase [Deinococcus psychrotolerans]AZI42761.1 aldo/keto reductase [Deinococcus psychrotolerans]
MTLEQIKLGTQGLVVSRLGLGCMGMSQSYGTAASGSADEAESLRVFEVALDAGLTFFDTADMYGVGKNEELVGRALGKVRDRVIIATKFALMRGPNGEMLGINGRPEYVHSAVDASLKRLNMDYIDLYYQHRVDPNVPIEETVGAMAELVQAGKVRYLGLSEATPEQIRRAHKVHPITALQSEYSLWNRQPEEEILPTVTELGIGFVPYSPLGRGFLTGELKSPDDFSPDDFRRNNPRFQGENFQKNLKLVQAVERMAKEKGVSTAQLALAWVLAQGHDLAPIPGTKRVKYLEDNLAALKVELSEGELQRLAEIAPVGVAAGARY